MSDRRPRWTFVGDDFFAGRGWSADDRAYLEAALDPLIPPGGGNIWLLYYGFSKDYPYQARRVTWEYGSLRGGTMDELIEEFAAEVAGTLPALRARKVAEAGAAQ